MEFGILGCLRGVCPGLLIWARSRYFLIGRGGILSFKAFSRSSRDSVVPTCCILVFKSSAAGCENTPEEIMELSLLGRILHVLAFIPQKSTRGIS